MKNVLRINAADYGIKNNTDITQNLSKLLLELKGVKEEKHLYFSSGVYYISTLDAHVIDNRIANMESVECIDNITYRRFGILIDGIENLTIHGNGSHIIFRSNISYIAILNSKNIELNDFLFDTISPNMHKITIAQIERNNNFIDFLLASSSDFMCRNGKYYFIGDNYIVNFLDYIDEDNCKVIRANSKYKINNSDHPFKDAKFIEKIRDRRFRMYGRIKGDFNLGDQFYIFPTKSNNLGIFIDKSNNININDVRISYADSYALLAQSSNNIYLDSFNCLPHYYMRLTSTKDLINLVNVRGNVKILNSKLKGANNAINIQNMDFNLDKISTKEKNITVSFAKEDTKGINFFNPGDKLEFVDKHSKKIEFNTIIESVKVVSDISFSINCVDEIPIMQDVIVRNSNSYASNVLIRNNYFDDLSNNAICIDSPNISINNNVFNDVNKYSIFVDNDYSTGNIISKLDNLGIYNNLFNRSGSYDIFIDAKGDFSKSEFPYGDIQVNSNSFKRKGKKSIYIKNAKNVSYFNNKYKFFKKYKKNNI